MFALSQAKLKVFSGLHLKKGRQVEHKYLAFGEKLLWEMAERCPQQLAAVVVADDYARELPPLPADVPGYRATIAQMKRLTEQPQPEGILAVVHMPEQGTPHPAQASLLLQDLNDPGNLGTLLRTAAWFGIPQVVCSANSVDCYNPKVVRASMGALLRLSVHYVADMAAYIQLRDEAVYAACLSGAPLQVWKPQAGDALLLGSESHGLPESLLSLPQVRPMTIAGAGSQESLNVAVAGGILMHHGWGNLS